jgi:hypothetical protein
VMLLDPAADWGLATRASEVLNSAHPELSSRLAGETQEAVVEGMDLRAAVHCRPSSQILPSGSEV